MTEILLVCILIMQIVIFTGIWVGTNLTSRLWMFRRPRKLFSIVLHPGPLD